MRTWLLTVLSSEDRAYQGHVGYDDDARRSYDYDNFVPNYKQVSVGDRVILRDKVQVMGWAIVEEIVIEARTKRRGRCPKCRATQLKKRKREVPAYRCRCGASFDNPNWADEPCQWHRAKFGKSYKRIEVLVPLQSVWETAVNINKQNAIQELDNSKADALIARSTGVSSVAQLETSTAVSEYWEGSRRVAWVRKHERNSEARAACIAHYGVACFVCGFDFGLVYGQSVAGLIEVHHLEPLAGSRQPRTVDPVEDLRPLCSNCHSVVHRRDPPYTMEEAKAMLQKRVDPVV
jgi:hypothetical protein